MFLDEFQELEKSSQAMLLDLLAPFSTFVSGTRVGEETKEWSADVQVIVAVNRPLRELLESKALRPDIHYRIWRRAGLVPLRDYIRLGRESGDVETYIRYRILRMQEVGIPVTRHPISRETVLERFRQAFTLGFGERDDLFGLRADSANDSMPIPGEILGHTWPGNFRELESLAHLLMDNGTVGAFGGEHRVRSQLEKLVERQPRTSRTSDTETTPAGLMARSWIAALRGERSVEAIATSLGLDRRTLRRRVELLAAGKPDLRRSFVTALGRDEREELAGAAREALQRLWASRK